jgi:hypothetical protein
MAVSCDREAQRYDPIAEHGLACHLPGWSRATSFCALDAWNEMLVASERSF